MNFPKDYILHLTKIQVENIEINTLFPCFTNFLKNSEYTQKGVGSNFLSKIPD